MKLSLATVFFTLFFIQYCAAKNKIQVGKLPASEVNNLESGMIFSGKVLLPYQLQERLSTNALNERTQAHFDPAFYWDNSQLTKNRFFGILLNKMFFVPYLHT